jgi:hypothetical protein
MDAGGDRRAPGGTAGGVALVSPSDGLNLALVASAPR